jgi:hypothetical protein
MSRYFKSVISTSNTKQAAIYFPYVVPLSTSHEASAPGVRRDGEQDCVNVDDTEFLLPPEFKDNRKFIGLLWSLNLSIAANSIYEDSLVDARVKPIWDRLEKNAPLRCRLIGDELVNALQRFFLDYKLDGELVDAPLFSTDQALPDESSDVSLVLAEGKLIDLDKTNWDHVLEFRQDKEAQEKLRRFRLFAFENYADKDRAFIEDDVAKRLDDHHAVLKSWGFETRAGLLTSTLNSKSAQAALGGSLLAAAAGFPASAGALSGVATIAAGGIAALGGAAAIGGAILEVGNISLQLLKRNASRQDAIRNNPISFFDYAREKLSPSETSEQGLP